MSESCCTPPERGSRGETCRPEDAAQPDAEEPCRGSGEAPCCSGDDADVDLPVAVVGAGPVGLSAAAHLALRDQGAVVLEAGSAPGSAVREWGHLRLFSPWSLCLDPAAVSLLEGEGWSPPPPDDHPTGRELVERYLEPLAAHPGLAPRIRYRHRVTDVTRVGRDRLKGTDRSETPFRVRFRGPDGSVGELRARAVVDASGTWGRPRPLGADGLPVPGEEGPASDRVRRGIPDVLGADEARYAGRRVAVVGAGHSAANVLLDLVRLGERAPGTRPVWIVRGGRPDQVYGGEDADELEARGRLGRRVRELVDAGRIELLARFEARRLEERGPGATLHARDGRSVAVDRVVGVTGFRPELEMASELRLDLDPVTEAPRELGPLIDPNLHSCGTVPPHGEAELRHPEPGFYLVGMKSYGRAPTFLLRTGYEQVRSVVAALAGDHEAARSVELELPETGACAVDAVLGDGAAADVGGVCCA